MASNSDHKKLKEKSDTLPLDQNLTDQSSELFPKIPTLFLKPSIAAYNTITLNTPGLTFIGRGKNTGIENKTISRRQIVIEVIVDSDSDSDCDSVAMQSSRESVNLLKNISIFIRCCGTNASGILPREGRRVVLKPNADVDFPLAIGDEIELLAGESDVLYKLKMERVFEPERAPNVLFFSNKIPSMPNGALIDDIHAKWFGNRGLLERHHGYIQWLFPTFQGSGVNRHAFKLKKKEAEYIRNNLDAAKRLISSYEMMLDFYGLCLVDRNTGKVAPIADEKQHADRVAFLNLSLHNHLRITRILCSLGHLGFERYRAPLIDMLQQLMDSGKLTTCVRSMKDYWHPVIEYDSPQHEMTINESKQDRQDSIYFGEN